MTKARDLANAGTALTTVSATELGYLDGVTSAVQTQIDAKQAVVSGVDNTEIGHLNGVTSAIQTQLDAKSSTTHTHASEIASQTGNSGKYLTTNGTVTSWAPVAATKTISQIATGSLIGSNNISIPSLSAYDDIFISFNDIRWTTDTHQIVLRINNSSGSFYTNDGSDDGYSWNSGQRLDIRLTSEIGSSQIYTGRELYKNNHNIVVRLTNCKNVGFTNYSVSTTGTVNDQYYRYTYTGQGIFTSAATVSSFNIISNDGTNFSNGTYTVYAG